MKLSEMILALEQMQAKLGDVEVLITDGHEGYGYRGDFFIQQWDEDGKSFVDIGVGGMKED